MNDVPLTAQTTADAQRDLTRQAQALLQAVPDGAIAIDLDGRIGLSNTHAELMLGNGSPITGRLLFELLPGHVREKVTAALTMARTTGSAQHLQEELADAAGHLVPVDIIIEARYEQHRIAGFSLIFRDLGNQRRIEQEIREREQLFRRIINVLPQFVAYVNADLTYRFANPSSLTLFGLPPEQMVGRKTRDVIGAKAHDAIKPFLDKVLSGKTAHYQRDLVYPDQKMHTIDGWLIPDVSSSGEVRGYYAILYDITHIKKAHEALRAKEEKMQGLFRVAPIGIGVSVNRVLTEVNDYLCRLLGYQQYQLVGTSSRLIYPSEEEFISVGRQRRMQIENYGSSVQECRMQRKNGSIVHALINAIPLDPHDLEAGIIFTVLDITERKQAEQAVKSHSATLNAIFNSAPSILALVDRDGRIDKINQRGLAFFNSDHQTATTLLCGPLFGCINSLGPEPCGEGPHCPSCPVRKRFADTFATGRAHHEEEGKMILVRGEQPVTYHLLISTSAITIDHDERVLVSITDISEIKRKENELTRQQIANDKLEQQYRQAQKMESVGRLAGGIAHDLNNLLAPILGYSEMLTASLSEADPRRSSVDQILYAGQRARDLIRQMLAFSRKQTLTFSTIDLNELLSQFHRLLRRTIREDIDIELQLDESLPAVRGDTGQLEQVILNLAVNAQDAMPGGGVLRFMTATADLDETTTADQEVLPAGRYVQLFVSDTGLGMDNDVCGQIFEPFFTTKDQHSGTGLGLSTVYGIVKQHQGAIEVASEPERGTQFTIYLPASTEGAVSATRQQAVPVPNQHGNEIILLAEDDNHLRTMVDTILRQYGYTVLSAGNGKEALELAEVYPGTIDLLLTDVVMPEMNGRDLHEQMAVRHPSIRSLFMSGYTSDILEKDLNTDKPFDYLQKPFAVKDLLNKIRTVIDRPTGAP